MSNYNLTFIDKISKKEFMGRTLISGESVLIFNHLTNMDETYTVYQLKKKFDSHPENKHKRQPLYCRPTISRRGRYSKAYKEYLGEAI